MEKIELTKEQLKDLLHTATGNVKDFVTDNDGFIKEWLDKQLILHPVIKSDAATKYAKLREKCEEIVYGDPDGETDQTEMIAEIVCEEFGIM